MGIGKYHRKYHRFSQHVKTKHENCFRALIAIRDYQKTIAPDIIDIDTPSSDQHPAADRSARQHSARGTGRREVSQRRKICLPTIGQWKWVPSGYVKIAIENGHL